MSARGLRPWEMTRAWHDGEMRPLETVETLPGLLSAPAECEIGGAGTMTATPLSGPPDGLDTA